MKPIWVTKYALTEGILRCDEPAFDTQYPAMVIARDIVGPDGKMNGFAWGYFHGKEWHADVDTAIQHAHMMRLKKIASLRKQILKLEKLEIKVVR